MVAVAFRVDASDRIGIGHVMRCLTLAEALRDRGSQTRFICRAHPGNLINLLRGRNMPVAALPAPEHSGAAKKPPGYEDWLGTTQEVDAQQTIQALGDEPADWLIVDHYGLDAVWEKRLRTRSRKLTVIDDLATRTHACDFLLDQNYFPHAEDRYRTLAPQSCSFALGPRYSLLRPEYADRNGILRTHDGHVRRVLIFLGGSDPHNITAMALQALAHPDFSHLEVDVIIGPNNRNRTMLEKAAAERPHTSVHGPQDHLADFLARADLAIGAGGSTTWERMCLGVPSVVVSIAENQRPVCEALAAAGLIRYLGTQDRIGVSNIRDALQGCLAMPRQLIEMSTLGRTVLDGRGTLRVVECLLPTATEALRLRAAAESDMDLYFHWANDPEVRRQSFHSDEIPLARHQDWYAAKLATDRSQLFVLQAGGLAVGQIRFDRDDAGVKIDYSIERPFRRRGWAAHLVALGMRQFHGPQRMVFHAEVKDSNLASKAVFRRLGFAESVSGSEQGGFSVFSLDPSDARAARTN